MCAGPGARADRQGRRTGLGPTTQIRPGLGLWGNKAGIDGRGKVYLTGTR